MELSSAVKGNNTLNYNPLSRYYGIGCEYVLSLQQSWDLFVCCLQMDFQVQYVL